MFVYLFAADNNVNRLPVGKRARQLRFNGQFRFLLVHGSCVEFHNETAFGTRSLRSLAIAKLHRKNGANFVP